MEKLRAEIEALGVKDEELTRTHLRNMHYLQNILKESKCLSWNGASDVQLNSNMASSSIIPLRACKHAHVNQAYCPTYWRWT